MLGHVTSVGGEGKVRPSGKSPGGTSRSTMGKEGASFTCFSIKQAPKNLSGETPPERSGSTRCGEATGTNKDRNQKSTGEGSMMDGRPVVDASQMTLSNNFRRGKIGLERLLTVQDVTAHVGVGKRKMAKR